MTRGADRMASLLAAQAHAPQATSHPRATPGLTPMPPGAERIAALAQANSTAACTGQAMRAAAGATAPAVPSSPAGCISLGVPGVGRASVCQSATGSTYSACKSVGPVCVGPSVNVNNKGQVERVCVSASGSVPSTALPGVSASLSVRGCVNRNGDVTAGWSVGVGVGAPVSPGGVPGTLSYSLQVSRDVNLVSLKPPSGPPSRTYFDHPSYWRR